MKRALPVKTKRIELEGDYQGWWADVRTNPPVGPLLDVISLFEAADKENIQQILPPLYEMLSQVIYCWNFVDEKGKDLPSNLSGFKQLPLDLIIDLAAKVQGVILEVPLAPSANS